MTNADRVRAMGDEELAAWIAALIADTTGKLPFTQRYVVTKVTKQRLTETYMLARFIEQEASYGSDYYHAILRGLQPGLAYTVDHIMDYGWYQSVFLVGFLGGFNAELFTLHDIS